MSSHATKDEAEKAGAVEPAVSPCNFRSAGRLSNDSIRHLRTMHEAFARNLAHSLDLFLGGALGIKMIGVEQIGAREFATSIASGCYLVPFTLMPMQNRIVTRFENSLMFPLLDLLLGGAGDPVEEARELTDIDEELIRSVTELIGVQLERTWKACSVSILSSGSIKPAVVAQVFATEERVISLDFEITLGSTQAGMSIVLPMAFCNILVRSTQPEASRNLGQEFAAKQRLRDRAMDCTMTISAEITGLEVRVGELIRLSPGTTLDLRAPVSTPVRVAVSNYPLFETTPVRRGAWKTAQIGRPCQPNP